jgi:AraC family transcriptional regulator, regulatory protein of adaptative response / methylated-DNA-[protein]-cysteine methyltransferase
MNGELRSDDWRWDAVVRRDAQADGRFFYGVTSTGIYCRPSCPSRRPRRERVRFFPSATAAESAGFRACRRCHPAEHATSRGSLVERAVNYLDEHAETLIPLVKLARAVGASPFHVQREFKKRVGMSPREYHAARRADRFRRELRSGRAVTDAIYEAGYGSPSRVYEASPTGHGMPPATYRRGGAGAEISYVVVRCALGWLLVAGTSAGVCAVKLGDNPTRLARELRQEFHRATLRRDSGAVEGWVRSIVEHLANPMSDPALPLDVRGTAFQWRVWRALQSIPAGETRSYAEVAESIGHPHAARAVARACATNPVSLLVPCHRVLPRDGTTGGYRWGVGRKARLLAAEKRSRIPRE